MQEKPDILLIYTGGTIGMIKNHTNNSLSAFNFNKLLIHIPEISRIHCNITPISFETPIDSSDMNLQDWQKLGKLIEQNYEAYQGFVILHGSDTMAYTASALSFMLENLTKPVIFTGSQLPIRDLRTDAKENLITAIEIASLQEDNTPLIREVCIYFEYKLYRGNRATKINTEDFEAFISPNYPSLGESGVRLKINENVLLKVTKNSLLKVNDTLNPHIGVLKIFPGIPLSFIKNFCETPNLKGIIIETFGAGNASTDSKFIGFLKEMLQSRIPVVNITQCLKGSIMLGKYETSQKLKEIGVFDGFDITFEAALTKLMFLLGKYPNEEITTYKQLFETSICGELTNNH